MGPRSFRIRISGPKIWSAPPKSHLPYNFCFINFFPSVTVAAVDALQTLFRAPLTPGVHPGGRNIAYDLALVKLGPHTKFGEDWSNGLAVHWIHTYRQTTWQIYIRFIFLVSWSCVFLQMKIITRSRWRLIMVSEGNPYWRGRLSTVDLLVLTSFDQLL